jgi:photosystem II stability/assembly factor-like uncharacterized protein
LYEQGVLATTDGGTTWTNIYSSLVDAGTDDPLEDWNTVVAADPLDERSVFVAAGGRLFLSSNAGTTWETLLERPAIGHFAVANDGQTIYALTYEAIVTSQDRGQTWGNSFPDPENPYASGNIAIDAVDPAVAYAVSQGRLFVTNTAGQEWSAPSFLSNVRANQVITDRQMPGLAYVITDKSSLYRTTDGGNTWGLVADLSRYDTATK